MNPDNPFIGKSIAVTGKLETDYLILGERPGNKLVKALALGITVLSEQEFKRMNS